MGQIAVTTVDFARLQFATTSLYHFLSLSRLNPTARQYARQLERARRRVAALILVPLVLLYQGWTYYVFRRRLGGETTVSG